jgi:hypothetical protein
MEQEKISFSIKSKSFALYKAIKHEAENAGWIWNTQFNHFEEYKMYGCDCLYFESPWNDEGRPMFAFSNSDGTSYSLPGEWDEAIKAIESLHEQKAPKQVKQVKVSLKEIAEWKGCAVSELSLST